MPALYEGFLLKYSQNSKLSPFTSTKSVQTQDEARPPVPLPLLIYVKIILFWLKLKSASNAKHQHWGGNSKHF